MVTERIKRAVEEPIKRATVLSLVALGAALLALVVALVGSHRGA